MIAGSIPAGDTITFEAIMLGLLKRIFRIISEVKAKALLSPEERAIRNDFLTSVQDSFEKAIEEDGNDSRLYQCENCYHWISYRTLSSLWDWSGPHCPHCGHGGMRMFAEVTGPIQNSKGVAIAKVAAIIQDRKETEKSISG